MANDDFTKIASGLLVNVRDLVSWGFETGNTTPEDIRYSFAQISEIAPKMIEAGYSQRKTAKFLGIPESTLRRYLAPNGAENAPNGAPAARTQQINTKKRKEKFDAPVEVKLPPNVYCGDFRKLSHEIADDSVQLVFTDPPYDKESTNLFRDAAAISARILKPGGSFISYCGHQQVPEVLNSCSQYLRFWWMIAFRSSRHSCRVETDGLVCQGNPWGYSKYRIGYRFRRP
jgi:hypothetical protein